MAGQNGVFKNAKLVFRKSRVLTKTVVVAAIVLSMVTLISLGVSQRKKAERIEQLQAQAVQLEQENGRLRKYISQLGSVESIRRIAGEVLGLVDPDTVFFEPDVSNAD